MPENYAVTILYPKWQDYNSKPPTEVKSGGTASVCVGVSVTKIDTQHPTTGQPTSFIRLRGQKRSSYYRNAPATSYFDVPPAAIPDLIAALTMAMKSIEPIESYPEPEATTTTGRKIDIGKDK